MAQDIQFLRVLRLKLRGNFHSLHNIQHEERYFTHCNYSIQLTNKYKKYPCLLKLRNDYRGFKFGFSRIFHNLAAQCDLQTGASAATWNLLVMWNLRRCLLSPRLNQTLHFKWASLVDQTVKNSPAMQKTWVRSLGWEDPLEKGTATHSSILTWRILMDRAVQWAI